MEKLCESNDIVLLISLFSGKISDFYQLSKCNKSIYKSINENAMLWRFFYWLNSGFKLTFGEREAFMEDVYDNYKCEKCGRFAFIGYQYYDINWKRYCWCCGLYQCRSCFTSYRSLDALEGKDLSECYSCEQNNIRISDEMLEKYTEFMKKKNKVVSTQSKLVIPDSVWELLYEANKKKRKREK